MSRYATISSRIKGSQETLARIVVAALESDIETAQADCGHLALFMGRRTLTEEWPRIARWLAR
jgi:hypothetical protein